MNNLVITLAQTTVNISNCHQTDDDEEEDEVTVGEGGDELRDGIVWIYLLQHLLLLGAFRNLAELVLPDPGQRLRLGRPPSLQKEQQLLG